MSWRKWYAAFVWMDPWRWIANVRTVFICWPAQIRKPLYRGIRRSSGCRLHSSARRGAVRHHGSEASDRMGGSDERVRLHAAWNSVCPHSTRLSCQQQLIAQYQVAPWLIYRSQMRRVLLQKPRQLLQISRRPWFPTRVPLWKMG